MYYFASAFTYLLGMVSSNMALQWVNYPTQVSQLAQSAYLIKNLLYFLFNQFFHADAMLINFCWQRHEIKFRY